jgi:phosphoserine phosphatase
VRVRARAEAFFDAHFDRRIFPQVRALLLALLAAGARVAIVSASNRWLIEAAGRRLGVARVAGVAVEVQGGRLTDRPLLPLPVDDGKVHWARALLGGAPSLAVGNGAIDRALLHSARHRLVICPSDDPETPLAEEARARGWPVLELAHPCSGEALP